ncbi:MAG: UDP-N-acetylmuramoyl-L-alanyl-D-glutamate--2,6-diaminopimelate ligase, partial [Armatimonadetes bacterium]|nr:UDP-N-acetylmuramoyl-L-alanyl-D-glutamate--2,6-diaminopimelate ligase [Armatimonadota bacterium]
VSSHALILHRPLGCEFDVGVFTNLTQDHLDFHADLEDYFQAKARLFAEYPRQSSKVFTGVINVDDPFGKRLTGETVGRVITYGIENPADLRAREIEARPTGITFTVADGEGERRIHLRLGGRFNVYNSLAAIGTARALRLDWDAIVAGLEAAPGVPGRFEAVDEGQPFAVIVDYAHTPDGLENVLRSARALQPRQLIVVFGCGGDRDRTKRPKMGRIAAELADRVVVTSDNPRSEAPVAIIEEILAGIDPADRRRMLVEVDRRAAIETAVARATPGDTVVIAGKGHEDYQILGDRKIHFDDREVAREALQAWFSPRRHREH